MSNDTLWKDLYWTLEQTRPDHLAKILNSIVQKESGNSERFVYDCQVAKDMMKVDHLTHHDKLRFEQFDKFKLSDGSQNKTNIQSDNFDNQTNISDKQQYILSRHDVSKFLREFFDNTYLEGDIIKPRPINGYLVKIGKFSTNTKLFSNTVLVRIRPNVHVLPLRCKSDENGGKSKGWLLDRIDRIENTLLNLSNIVENKIINVQNKISIVENAMEQISTSWKQDTDDFASININQQIDHAYKNLTGIMKEKLNFFKNVTLNTKWKQNGITVAGGNEEGNNLNQLFYAYGIYVDNNQTIYVADLHNDRIVEWKSHAKNGQVVAGGNGQGNQTNQLYGPTDVTVDKENDSLIICDGTNRRVMQWFRENNKSGQIIISNIDCYGLAMDNKGYIYISDMKNNQVTRWKIGDENGTIVAGGNEEGDHLNQLRYPTYIFVDEDYSIYISDYYNHRVMKWIKDAKEGIVVAGGNGQGDTLSQLSNPSGVIVDQLGQIYVADTDNFRVMCWSKEAKQGRIIVGGNGWGEKSNQFKFPSGLSFDEEGNLYVSDQVNFRIQKFEID
ncbi:unnamed protein product [Adineta steineri]|uniref:NHL repeat containing protein n=1 Tax=Adineta steineri TaxID=433720 RepID=A0A815HQF0_9BILA|nr:unnamed protein product [Adineta steineri]CAF3770768.1 unnamed protein product [Adineta steineri]